MARGHKQWLDRTSERVGDRCKRADRWLLDLAGLNATELARGNPASPREFPQRNPSLPTSISQQVTEYSCPIFDLAVHPADRLCSTARSPIRLSFKGPLLRNSCYGCHL